jgi:ribosomal protein L3 glutamine methyltransferase
MTKHTELKTIRDYGRYAASRFNEAGLFFGHGTDNAWDDAMALILHALHLPHNVNPAILDANLIAAEQASILALIEKRVASRIPVAYLTKEAWLAGMSFYVDERVLIPRSPIAELIENHFEPWILEEEVHNILDLCTGSGCLAIACAKAFPAAEVDASDVSADALAVAKINVLRHDVEDQVHLHQSDLFQSLPAKKYNVIISNPPYVSAEEMSNLPAEYKHEPALGLAAGHTGTDFAAHILQQAPKYLAKNGILIIEVGNSEYALAEQFPNLPFTWLEFQRGGGGVLLLTAEMLLFHAPIK